MFRALLILALASCALAVYVGLPSRYSHSYRAPTYNGVPHLPTFGYGYGHGLGYGYGTYGLGYGLHHGYGFGGHRYVGY